MFTAEEGMMECKQIQDNQNVPSYTLLSDDKKDENAESKSTKFTLRKNLTARDLKSISNNQALNDTVIQVFQAMIQQQYPEMGGLQDPVLGTNLTFSIYQSKPFLQILYNGSFHWIAVSTYECEPGENYYMDSLFQGRIADKVKQQICSITHSSTDFLKIKVLLVQQKTNGVDCGIYAVTFVLYYAMLKRYPTEVTFNQSLMRHHLLRALAANKLEEFPFIEKTGRKFKQKEIVLELHCNCRMCWVSSDNAISCRSEL